VRVVRSDFNEIPTRRAGIDLAGAACVRADEVIEQSFLLSRRDCRGAGKL